MDRPADDVAVHCYVTPLTATHAVLLPPEAGAGPYQPLRVHPAELHLVVAPQAAAAPGAAAAGRPAASAAAAVAGTTSWAVEDAFVPVLDNDDGDGDAFAARADARTRPAATRSSLPADLARHLADMLPELRAIVTGEAPSWRRDAYFGSGRDRARLRQQYGYAGVPRAESEALAKYLLDWFVGSQPSNVAASVGLVMDVLVPEAILRLLMARRRISYEEAERVVAGAGAAEATPARPAQSRLPSSGATPSDSDI